MLPMFSTATLLYESISGRDKRAQIAARTIEARPICVRRSLPDAKRVDKMLMANRLAARLRM